MATVLIYRRDLLAYSETFIVRQVHSLTRWQPILAGHVLPNGLSLDGLNIRSIGLPDPSKVQQGGMLSRLRGPRTFNGTQFSFSPYERAKPSISAIRKMPWFPSLQASRPRLLHVHFGTNAEEAWPLAMALEIPMVVTLHGYDAGILPSVWESGIKGPRYLHYPAALREMAKHGVKFIAVSDAAIAGAKQYGLTAASLRKILIGVDTKAIAASEIPMTARPRRVLFAGRFVEKKGAVHLIRAFANVLKVVPDAELTLMGDGYLEPELKRLVRLLALPVTFTGRLPVHRVLAEMRNARVLCVPSIRAQNGDSEGLPTVIPEAQASGLPVVTSAPSGATEGIVDGITGIAFPERDETALTAALIHYLTNDAAATDAAVAARRFAEDNLEMADRTRELEDYYDRLTA